MIDADFILSLFEEQGGRCYWTGVPMVPSTDRSDPAKPSIDRLDGSLGYVAGNCVLACWFANRGRGTTDTKRFAAFMASMKAAIIEEAKRS